MNLQCTNVEIYFINKRGQNIYEKIIMQNPSATEFEYIALSDAVADRSQTLRCDNEHLVLINNKLHIIQICCTDCSRCVVCMSLPRLQLLHVLRNWFSWDIHFSKIEKVQRHHCSKCILVVRENNGKFRKKIGLNKIITSIWKIIWILGNPWVWYNDRLLGIKVLHVY